MNKELLKIRLKKEMLLNRISEIERNIQHTIYKKVNNILYIKENSAEVIDDTRKELRDLDKKIIEFKRRL